MEPTDDVQKKNSQHSESIELEQLSEDKDKPAPEIQEKEKTPESPKLTKVSPISKTQSLVPTSQTTSARIEASNKKMRQSQPSLPIPSDINITSGSKPSSTNEDLKYEYNVEELRMRLKERPSAAMRMMQQSIYLERVASVGPCVRTLNDGPSGIMIIIPKKSSRTELDPEKMFESKLNRIRSTFMTLKTTKQQFLPRTASLYGRVSTFFRQYWSSIFVTTDVQDKQCETTDQDPEINIAVRDSIIESEIAEIASN